MRKGPRRTCAEDGAADGQKKAAARVRQRQIEELSAPRIDGRIPRRPKAGNGSARSLTGRPIWNPRFSVEDSGNGQTTSTSRGRPRGPRGSNRLQTTHVVERADGDVVASFQRKEIICHTSRSSGEPEPFVTSTGVSPIKKALLDKAQLLTGTSAPVPSTYVQEREEAALDRLEKHLLELETAEDLLRHSLGDFESNTRDENIGVDAICESNSVDDDEDKAPFEPETLVPTPSNEVASTNIQPSRTDISLSKDVEETLSRHAKAYKYRRRRVEESLSRSGVSATKVLEM